MILRDVYAEIDLNAIRHNLTKIRRHINPNSKFCVVVKANAYGHGAIEVSKVAVECGADFLAVATVDEGIELRRAGFTLPILILGLIPKDAVDAVVANDLTQAVADFDFAEKISEAAQRLCKVAKVHLKIETGTPIKPPRLPKKFPNFRASNWRACSRILRTLTPTTGRSLIIKSKFSKKLPLKFVRRASG